MSTKIRDDFAILILSHNRYQDRNFDTRKLLETSGYTGKWYFVLDDEDPGLSGYEQRFGKDKMLIFNKKKVAETLDNM